MDIKIKHLYEVAVITAFTATPKQNVQQDAPHQVAPQIVTIQLPQNHSWDPAPDCWNLPTGHGDNSWTPSASVNGNNHIARQPYCVENAASVSKFTSEESTPSWETDTWSRESLVSQESVGDPNYPQNYVNYAANLPNTDSGFMDPESAFDAMVFYSGAIIPDDILPDEVPFISGPVHPEDLWETENCPSVIPYCEVAGEGLVTQQNHFEVMLDRVAQDLTSLEVNPTEYTTWQAQAPICEMYLDSFRADQTFYNGFPNIGSDGSRQEFHLQQNLVSWATHGVCDMSSTVPFETDHYSHSIADSGRVSRASSLTSLVATTYSDVSEDNLADMESCESVKQQRVKFFKPKNSYQVRSNIYPSKASVTSQEKSQARMPVFVDSSSQNIRRSTDSYRSTSGCSESVASYSLSSDSEIDLQSHANTMNLAQLTDLKRATLSAIHSSEAENSATEWNHNDYQNSQVGLVPSYASRPNMYHNQHNGMSLWDSGIDNTGNMTHHWDTSQNTYNDTSNVFTNTYCNESRYPMENAKFNIYPSCTSFSSCYTNDIAKVAAREPPPYNCSLDHGSEFIPVEDLEVKKLPQGYQRWEHLKTILEISHRVVKLRVHKQFKMTQQENISSEGKSARTSDDEEPVLEHYGTGFACHVGTEMVVIRTHSELVRSSLEASSTDVIFDLTFPNRSLNREITCKGLPDSFSSNDYSQTTKFMCKTPPDLISYMHLFKAVPVVRQNSLFNDSSYFTDSSPDTSASGPDELENDQKGTTLQKDNENTSEGPPGTDVANRAGVWGRPLSGLGNSSCLYSHVLANRNEESLKHTTQTAICFDHSLNFSAERHQKYDYTKSQQEHAGHCVNIADYEHNVGDSFITATTNRFINLSNTFLPDDTIIINKVNLSPGQTHQPSTVPCVNLHWNPPDAPWQNCEQARPDLSIASQYQDLQQVITLPSPLVIMEKRYDILKAASGTTYCPYADMNIFGGFGAYTNFSSFAGEVFNSLTLDNPSGSTSKTDDSEDASKWEYERLLFLQNQHRQAYNKVHVLATQGNAGRLGDLRNAPLQDAHTDAPKLSKERSVSTAAQERTESNSLTNGENASSKYSAAYSETLVKLQTLTVGDSTMEDEQRSDQPSNEIPESSSLLKESDGSSGSTSGSNRRNIFAEFSSVSDYLDTWDIELLNLDTDLSPLPDEDFFETMVSDLLKDTDDPRQDIQCSPACCPQDDFSQKSSSGDSCADSCASTRQASVCLVISHPHGGPKMISTGWFSRHRHVGGILYDTPTCMGSCGAPVVSLTDNAVSPYLTHFVHSGTVKVNGVPVGAGVAYFDT